ncbi:MazG-like family protein [Streptomyces sp. NPDC093261]|uniref:MazG-like family protein n=1 Tax=Streptomyces sp. NPDC093261 TaxID=3366037 RepID=UPI003806277A
MTDSATDAFAQARRISQRLDAVNGTDEHEYLIRLLKVVEEAGEAAQAYIGATGQNPRKGVTHRHDVAAELCDVIVAAMVAMHGFHPDPQALFGEFIKEKADRLDAGTHLVYRDAPHGEYRCTGCAFRIPEDQADEVSYDAAQRAHDAALSAVPVPH